MVGPMPSHLDIDRLCGLEDVGGSSNNHQHTTTKIRKIAIDGTPQRTDIAATILNQSFSTYYFILYHDAPLILSFTRLQTSFPFVPMRPRLNSVHGSSTSHTPHPPTDGADVLSTTNNGSPAWARTTNLLINSQRCC